MERIFEEISFDAPERRGERIEVTPEMVREKLADICEDEDLSRFVL